MKKFLAIILSLVILAGVLAGCSTKDDNKETTTKGTTEITTDEAVIKEADAIDYIKSYSAKELGLSDEDYKTCSFMVGGQGIEIDGEYFIKVVAAIKNKHVDDNGKETFTFDIKGEYYISYDGKKVLQKDLTAEKDSYNELELKKASK